MLVLQGVVDGVLAGGFYALMGAGLTLVFGVMEILLLAQGALVVLGAYLSYALSAHYGIDPFVGLLVTMPVMFLVGYGIYWLLIKPIKRDRVVMSLLVMVAVAALVEGLLDVIFSSDLVEIHASYINDSYKVGAVTLPAIYVYAFALSVLILSFLYFILHGTKFGVSLRATTQNPVAARLAGIVTDRVSATTLGIGVAMAAAGGMIFGATNSFNAASSYDLISRLIVIVILGGLGSIGGTLAAAVLMLVIEDVVAVVWSPLWGQTTFYLVLVVVLLVRPQGLFGKRAVRAQ
ncbi:MAG TPA: branched-chain amino acid ABC transporter permease [Streptosporangiaceae bacterium]